MDGDDRVRSAVDDGSNATILIIKIIAIIKTQIIASEREGEGGM